MSVSHIIAAGIGFNPGLVEFIVTRGLGVDNYADVDVSAMATYRKRRIRKPPDDTQARLDAQREAIELAQQQIEAARLRQEQLEAQNSVLLAEAQALAILRAEIAAEMQAIDVMNIVMAELQAQRQAELMQQAQMALEQQKQEDYQMRVAFITQAMDDQA